MYFNISSHQDYSKFISENKFAVVYFSSDDCNVCKVFRPKLAEFLEKNYPSFKLAYLNTEVLKEIAAQLNVFTIPTILFFIDGKEQIRKARFVNFLELHEELERIFNLV
ncbi:MAG: thioredoxin family protein [Ignavibacteria bacterium]|nr:thioredoxin family protein [Ignavibacteria bacterium]